jgi:phage baseplate assembly protein W
MANNTRTFSDFDLNFTAHPVTGDIVLKTDESAIKQSVKNLLLTRNFERPFHSEIGSPIRQLLFDLPGPMFTIMLRKAIIDVINNFEPRVNIIDIEVNDQLEENAVNVTLIFSIVNTTRPITLDLALERTR